MTTKYSINDDVLVKVKVTKIIIGSDGKATYTGQIMTEEGQKQVKLSDKQIAGLLENASFVENS